MRVLFCIQSSIQFTLTLWLDIIDFYNCSPAIGFLMESSKVSLKEF